jgi:hypothetical protein
VNELRSFAPAYNRTGIIAGPVVGQCLPSVTVVAVNATAVASAIFPGQAGNNSLVQIQISNKTSVWVHVNFGVFGAVRASVLTDYPVPPGSVVVVSVDAEVTGASVFADGGPAGSTSVMFTRGSGI